MDDTREDSTENKPLPPAPAGMSREAQKALIKEALKEWLDSQWVILGKWSAKGIGAALFSAGAYWWLTTHGWHR